MLGSQGLLVWGEAGGADSWYGAWGSPPPQPPRGCWALEALVRAGISLSPLAGWLDGESLPSQGLGPEGVSLDHPQGTSAGAGRPSKQMLAICRGLLPAQSASPVQGTWAEPVMHFRGRGSWRG